MQIVRQIKLNGILGRKFGKTHSMAVNSPAEAVRALSVQIKGFKQFLINSSNDGIEYQVFVGNEQIYSDDKSLLNDLLKMNSKYSDIEINPVIVGGKGGFFGAILGVALIGAAIALGPAAGGIISGWGMGIIGATASTIMFSMGASMLLGGITQMLTPKPKMDAASAESPENKPSYFFNGAVNTMESGHPVPLLYGKLLVGSACISLDITNYDIPV